mmetsp:Transcript_11184/g.21026  ORF Transcript_11184/g.21026 Transcript_11184/m.21026 type:complete len:528 (+) Transcript_11184:81-1664(+)
MKVKDVRVTGGVGGGTRSATVARRVAGSGFRARARVSGKPQNQAAKELRSGARKDVGGVRPLDVACCATPLSRQACFVLLNPEGEVERLDNGRVRTKVFIDMYIIDKAYDSITNYYRNNVEIPGFRKGSAIPESMIMNQVGKEQYFLAVLEEIFKMTLEGAFAKLGDRVLSDTETIETPTEEMVKAVVTRKPFKYSVSADVLPDVKWKTPYADMKIKVDTSAYSIPDEEKVNEIFESFRKEQAQLSIAVGRKVKRGDMCVVEATCVKKDTGEPALGVPEGAFRYDTDVSSLPNFVENLEKLGVGEETEFDVDIPQDWPDENVRGWQVSFKVKVNEIFEKKLPELNDAFAAQIVPTARTLEEAREFLLKNIAGGKEEAKLQALQNAVTESIADCLDISIPESMVRNIGREEYGKKLMELQAQGTLSPEMIQKFTSEKIVSDYIEKERGTFEMLAKASIGIAEILKLEKLVLSQEAFEEELDKIRAQYAQESPGQELEEDEQITQAVRERSETKLVFDWIQENCSVEYV